MAKILDWENHIGRRIKLRDLHVFFTVLKSGSVTKAAAQLGVSPPAVSQVISDLEHALGVKLFDRSPQGMEPTAYGYALLKGGAAAFDDLKQTIKEIEFLADPTVGEVRIGCPETVAAILPPIIHRLYQKHPGITVHVSEVIALTLNLQQIRDRSLDLALVRLTRHQMADDLNIETLFTDEAVVVAGANSPWANCPTVDLADLAQATWILPPGASMNCTIIKDAFLAAGLPPPKIGLVTFSVVLRTMLLTTNSHYLTVFPRSMTLFCAEHMGLKILPVKLSGSKGWPVVIITLKGRTLNPVSRLFINHVRAAVSLLTPDSTTA